MIPANDPLKLIEQLPRRKRDLSDIAGSWAEDPDFDAALAEQDAIWPDRETAESVDAAEKANS